jgi:hypothetical protein
MASHCHVACRSAPYTGSPVLAAGSWITELAEGLEELHRRADDFAPGTLADDDRFVDAMVTAIRTVEHTHQREKITALRNAVLNSAAPGHRTQTPRPSS